PVTSHLTVRGKIANLFDKDYETVYGYQTAGREYTLSGSYTFCTAVTISTTRSTINVSLFSP
ncbi:hypothetical protein KU406_23335, partial [Salmonella enterica subsp. enterica serovar Montevideo]|nr:hypothetical protein [Salmonella enterica subsp. enterica serovar Montevideo]